jgi:hypothetical protein
MTMASPSPARRLMWLLALLILLLLPLLPAIDIALIAWRASALKCTSNHAATCMDGMTSLGPRLEGAVEAAVSIGQLLMVGVIPWLLVAFLTLHHIGLHLGWRLTAAALVTAFLMVAPYVAPLAAFSLLEHDGCRPHGVLMNPCQMLGTDMTRPANALAGLPLWLLVTAIVAPLTYLAYLAVALIRRGRAARRTAGANRAE